MKQWNKILRPIMKIVQLSGWIYFLVVNMTAYLLFNALTDTTYPDIFKYLTYVISFIVLIFVIIRLVFQFKKMNQKLHQNQVIHHYLIDSQARLKVSLYTSLLINLVFAVFKIIMGTLYQSSWMYAMAGYYVILSLIRFILAYYDMKSLKMGDEKRFYKEVGSFKLCGWFLLILNMAMSVIVGFVVFQDTTIHYPGFLIYAIAAYTFYTLISALIQVIKYWKKANPLYSEVKRITLAKGLVSLFTLQVALLNQFGDFNPNIYKLANGATGSVICILILLLAISMIRYPMREKGVHDESGK